MYHRLRLSITLLVALSLLSVTISHVYAQEKELTQDDYGFQLNDNLMSITLPYGYESVKTIELDTKLYPHLKYKVGFWVTATKSPKWESYNYYFSLFPFNAFDTPTDDDRRLAEPTDIISQVEVSSWQSYEKKYLSFEVHPDTTYTHMTIALDQRNGDYLSYKQYLNISGIFVSLEGSADAKNDVNAVIEERKLVDKGDLFTVNEETFTMSLYDHKSIDGDIVTIYLNDEIIVDKLTLKRKKQKFKGKLKPGKNTIRLHANNLGKIPPNTVAIIIKSGREKITQILTSDLDKSEYFTLIYDDEALDDAED